MQPTERSPKPGVTYIKRRKKRRRLQVVEPPRVRRDDPGTSYEGAKAVGPRLTALRAAILQYALDHDNPFGFISDDLEKLGIGGRCPWHRAGDLADFGWLDRLYDRRGRQIKRPGRFSGGASQQAFRINDFGREVLGC